MAKTEAAATIATEIMLPCMMSVTDQAGFTDDDGNLAVAVWEEDDVTTVVLDADAEARLRNWLNARHAALAGASA